MTEQEISDLLVYLESVSIEGVRSNSGYSLNVDRDELTYIIEAVDSYRSLNIAT